MAISLPKLNAWKLAEQEARLARHRWQSALGFSLGGLAAERELKAELTSKREYAHALFLEAMDEVTDAAWSLHHQNFLVERP